MCVCVVGVGGGGGSSPRKSAVLLGVNVCVWSSCKSAVLRV